MESQECQGEKRVLLGVTGGIAAYKSCELLRALQKAGFDVQVVMTEAATRFVGPLTFETLSGHPAATALFAEGADPLQHINLAKRCDVALVAPCTANVLSKLARGAADDVLSATMLALPAATPLLVAPAMNVHMYEHPATQENLRLLKSRGVRVVEAASGYLACGEEGPGRLADIDAIVAAVSAAVSLRDLEGLSLLITAGPTREPLDPVRFLSNRSSGKMGYALAQAALRRGARVLLISGPVSIPAPAGADIVAVETALEMHKAVMDALPDVGIAIFAAAAADMRPKNPAERKLKKRRDDERLQRLELTENPDILADAVSHARPDQLIVGFAAETENLIEHAKAKLQRKGCGLLVANLVGQGRGFDVDDDKIALLAGDEVEEFPLLSKSEAADIILDKALSLHRPLESGGGWR